jgi:hypothetical protein
MHWYPDMEGEKLEKRNHLQFLYAPALRGEERMINGGNRIIAMG